MVTKMVTNDCDSRYLYLFRHLAIRLVQPGRSVGLDGLADVGVEVHRNGDGGVS
jgi:hypothetical protein